MLYLKIKDNLFSKSCEYGILATLYVAKRSDEGSKVGVKEIATETDIPAPFTAKILQQLAKSGVIDSYKGPTGGFHITASRINMVSLADIVEAIDGDRIFNGCGLGLSECNANKPCAVHDHFISIRNDLKKMLKNTTLRDLMIDIENGKTVLKR